MEQKTKRKYKRSPNFPVIDLQTAVNNTEKIYKADGRAGSRKSAVYAHLGYKGAHGVSRTVLSALKKFGLIREEGDKIYLTKEAEIIFMVSDPEKKKSAIKYCALKPEIYNHIWNQYSKSGLPSNETLKDQLIFEYDFNEKAVDSFIKNFKETLAYANIEAGEENEETKEGEEMKTQTAMPDLIFTTKKGEKVVFDVKIKDYLIPRKNDKVAILRLEKPVYNEDIDLIVKWLELLRSTIVYESQEEANN